MEKYNIERETIVAAYMSHHPGGKRDLIDKAFDLAVNAHEGQMRQSGDPYITHPIGVALTVSKLGLDAVSVAAALCHDTVEDCETTLDDVTRELGSEVAMLVDGVTKLDKVKSNVAKSQQNAEAKAATLRKLLVAVAKDVRVLIIKLCDRLHNVGSLDILPTAKAQRIAAETLEVYAPLAHRLGMSEIKWKLEDESFKALYPERYAEIDSLVSARSFKRDEQLAAAVEKIQNALTEAGIKAEVDGRSKHYWSIYTKMTRRNKNFDEIFDLLGIRIIVNDVKDCYSSIGVTHALYPPVPGRFKDYIAQPKFNSYSALHSTVVGPGGKVIELQIRTRDMHSRAEVGIAAHWSYKTGGIESPDKEPSWLSRLLDVHAETDDPDAFLANVREDLAGEEVVCFSPKGDCVSLPVGASALDFAYTIHTQIGHQAVGAKINGKLVPLATVLKTGDTIEIVTSKEKGLTLQASWLNHVVTAKARASIRSKLHQEAEEETIESGKEQLSKLLRFENIPSFNVLNSPELNTVASSLNYDSLDSLFNSIGDGSLDVTSVVKKLKTLIDISEGVRVIVPDAPPTFKNRKGSQSAGLHAEGITDLVLRLAACCSPEPGDSVMGYITKDRGVIVHRDDCGNVPSLLEQEKTRCIDVEWTNQSKGTYLTQIEIEGIDRGGLLSDVTKIMSDMGVHIHSCVITTDSDLVAHQKFEIELADTDHLNRLSKAIKHVEGVYSCDEERN